MTSRGIWNSSCTVRGLYMFMRDRNALTNCPLQIATQSRCSEVVEWALERKIDEEETQAICFSRRLRVPEEALQMRRANIPCVNNVKYLGVFSDRRIRWWLHMERTADKALGICRIYSLLNTERLNINIKTIHYRALIMSITVYACST
jgi:hypothetical protein